MRGDVADDIAIHGGRGDWPVEDELDVRLVARSKGLVAKQNNARANLRRGVMKADRKPLVDRLLFAGQEAQAGVNAVRRRVQVGVEHEITASDRLLLDPWTRQVERAAIARLGDLGSSVLRMQGPNAGSQPGWTDLDPVAHTDGSGIDRARDHHADATQGEDAVDGETKAGPRRSIARDAARRFEVDAQRVDTLSGHRREGQHARVRERRVANRRSRITLDLGQSFVGRQVRFRKYDDAAVDSQQVEDR